MCAYHVPNPVRKSIEHQLESGITSTASIAGHLHQYDFAVEIKHRISIIEQVKDEYRAANPTPTYTVADEPLSDDALDAALDSQH